MTKQTTHMKPHMYKQRRIATKKSPWIGKSQNLSSSLYKIAAKHETIVKLTEKKHNRRTTLERKVTNFVFFLVPNGIKTTGISNPLKQRLSGS